MCSVPLHICLFGHLCDQLQMFFSFPKRFCIPTFWHFHYWLNALFMSLFLAKMGKMQKNRIKWREMEQSMFYFVKKSSRPKGSTRLLWLISQNCFIIFSQSFRNELVNNSKGLWNVIPMHLIQFFSTSTIFDPEKFTKSISKEMAKPSYKFWDSRLRERMHGQKSNLKIS